MKSFVRKVHIYKFASKTPKYGTNMIYAQAFFNDKFFSATRMELHHAFSVRKNECVNECGEIGSGTKYLITGTGRWKLNIIRQRFTFPFCFFSPSFVCSVVFFFRIRLNVKVWFLYRHQNRFIERKVNLSTMDIS